MFSREVGHKQTVFHFLKNKVEQKPVVDKLRKKSEGVWILCTSVKKGKFLRKVETKKIVLKMSESKYRSDLPQLKEEKLFLVDGGLETHLVYHQGKYFYEHLS